MMMIKNILMFFIKVSKVKATTIIIIIATILTIIIIKIISKVSAIKAFLSMQHPAHTPAINPSTLDIQVLSIILISLITTMIIKMMMMMTNNQVEDYIAPRFSHKRKSKLRQKILEAHANVKVEIINILITQMSKLPLSLSHMIIMCILSYIIYILSYCIYDHF